MTANTKQSAQFAKAMDLIVADVTQRAAQVARCWDVEKTQFGDAAAGSLVLRHYVSELQDALNNVTRLLDVAVVDAQLMRQQEREALK